MHNFPDEKGYIAALRTDPSLAVISVQMAANALGVTRAAVERQLKESRLEGFKVGKTRCVRASSVHAQEDAYRAKVAKVRRLLEGIAASRSTTEYAPVMAGVGLTWRNPKDRGTIGKILGDISEESNEAEGFMLSALVFNRNAGRPSPSFFLLAGRLGHDVDNEVRFLNEQLMEIWQHYGRTKRSARQRGIKRG